MDPGRDPRLQTEWNATLASLGLSPDGPILLGGPDVAALADALRVAVAAESREVTVIGSGAQIDVDRAVPRATGAPDGLFSTVVMLRAWDDVSFIHDVVHEAVRVTKPGGTVWLGDLNVTRLLRSTAGQYRSTLLYRMYPNVAAALRRAHSGASLLDVEAVRAGLKSVTAVDLDLPVAVVDSAHEYREAVSAGMWRGVIELDREDLAALLDALDDILRDTVVVPVVEREPWHLVRGTKPR